MSKIVGFVSTILIVRLISPESFAYLTYTDILYSYINLFLGMGMGSALLRYGRKGADEDNMAYLTFALRWGTLFQLTVCLAAVVTVWFVGLTFPQSWPLFLGLTLYPVLSYLLHIGQSLLRIELRNKEFALVGVVHAGLVLALSVVLVLALDVSGVIWARYIAIVAVCCWLVILYRRSHNRVIARSLSHSEKANFLKLSWAMLLANLFSTIIPINEAFLVAQLIRNEVVTAGYRVAVLIPSQLITISSAVMIYAFPRFAQMRSDRVWSSAKTAGLWTMIAVGLMAIIGVLLTPFLVNTLFGPAYSGMINLAQLFWIPYALNAGFRIIPMNVLPAIGHARFNAVMSVCSCFVHLVLDYYLISVYGILGAVYATILVYLVSGIGYWVYLRRVGRLEVT